MFFNSRKNVLSAIGVAVTVSAVSSTAVAGPFAPAAGKAGSTAVSASDPSIVAWATGYQDYVVGGNVDANWQTPLQALGPAGNSDGTNKTFTYDIVCLGNNGKITLTFDKPITDGPGADFLVFENGFGDTFLELGYVEVSSDGVNFTRFPNFSYTASPVGGFGAVDPTNIDGYASKYRGGFGTPFDLNIMAGTPGLDITAVTHVRLVDIVGDGSAYDSFPVELGGPRVVYDPHPTVGSAGLDLDAVGVIHQLEATEEPEVPLTLEGQYRGSQVKESSSVL